MVTETKSRTKTKREALAELHKRRIQLKEEFKKARSKIEKDYLNALCPTRSTFNAERARLKQEYQQKLQPVIAQFEKASGPIELKRHESIKQLRSSYDELLFAAKVDYQTSRK